MPHLHTQPGGHDLTASAYIILLGGAEPKLILHQHKKLKQLLQFGGHVEHKETPWQAIAHELAEESGYQLSQLQVLQPEQRLTKLDTAVLHPYPISLQTHHFPDIDHYHTDVAFAFTTTEQPVGTIHPGESTEISAFTEAQLLDIPAADIIENVRQTGMFIFRTVLPDWRPVPTESFSLD